MRSSSCRSLACRRTSWRATFLPAGQVQTHSPASGASWTACESLLGSSTHLRPRPQHCSLQRPWQAFLPACLCAGLPSLCMSHEGQGMASQEAVHAAVSTTAAPYLIQVHTPLPAVSCSQAIGSQACCLRTFRMQCMKRLAWMSISL